MTLRSLCVAAALLFAVASAPAARGESLSAAILNCAALPSDAAQLACYKRIAAQLKTDAAHPATAPSFAAPPQAAAPAARDTGSASAQNTFGSAEAPEPLDRITDSIAQVTVSSFGHFTVTLKNGQVWQQTEGSVAHLHKDQTVVIKHGSLGGYHLSILSDVGIYGSYEVKRIK